MSEVNRTKFRVLRAQSNDRQALDDLLKDCQAPLYRYLVSLLGNPADAEDALQMTFVQVCRKLCWLRDPALFRPWTYRIAARIAYRLRKRRHGQSQLNGLDYLTEHPDEASVVDVVESEFRESLPALLETLTAKCREVIVLHYLEEFSVPQIAAILDIPVGTAKSRLSYAMACLRKTVIKQKGTHE